MKTWGLHKAQFVIETLPDLWNYFPSGKGCPRCGGQVFHAEAMFSKGKTYHKKCFSCNSCKRPLDSVLVCDAPDGEIYCKGCYAKNFGAKGQLILKRLFGVFNSPKQQKKTMRLEVP